MTDTKEALAALDWLETSLAPVRASDATELAKVRACLQSVAQEREDWRAIEAWLGTDDDRDCHIGPSAAGPIGTWTCRLVEMHFHGSRFNADGCPTRAEALSKAATWCRAEMAKCAWTGEAHAPAPALSPEERAERAWMTLYQNGCRTGDWLFRALDTEGAWKAGYLAALKEKP